MAPTLQSVVVSFAVLLALFRGLELLRSRDQRLPILRRGFWTDLFYWGFTPLVGRLISTAGVAIIAVPVVYALYGKVDRNLILHGFGPLSRLPYAVQAGIIIVISDFIGYWTHRGFHGARLWKFHAVHHSSVDLDWLSAVRVHPINDLLMRAASTLPILLTGVAPIAVAGVLPLLTLLAILLHANVDWDWGPLRAVVASPRFHRWHHTSQAQGLNKNFSGLLPAWDILFGTYFMPQDKPMKFGAGEPVPDGLLGQMLFPFLRAKPPA